MERRIRLARRDAGVVVEWGVGDLGDVGGVGCVGGVGEKDVELGCVVAHALGAWGGRRPWLERERGHLAAWVGQDAWVSGWGVALDRGA